MSQILELLEFLSSKGHIKNIRYADHEVIVDFEDAAIVPVKYIQLHVIADHRSVRISTLNATI